MSDEELPFDPDDPDDIARYLIEDASPEEARTAREVFNYALELIDRGCSLDEVEAALRRLKEAYERDDPHRLYRKDATGTIECVICGLTPDAHDEEGQEDCSREYLESMGARPSLEVPD